MEDVLAACDGFRPALVGGEVSLGEGEAIACVDACDGEHGTDIGLAGERADGSADAIAGLEELGDAVGGYEACSAGDEYEIFVHGRSVSVNRTFVLVKVRDSRFEMRGGATLGVRLEGRGGKPGSLLLA